MPLKITSSFDFKSQEPNFIRDVVDTSKFEYKTPFVLLCHEKKAFYEIYNEGHIVYDTATQKLLVWRKDRNAVVNNPWDAYYWSNPTSEEINQEIIRHSQQEEEEVMVFNMNVATTQSGELNYIAYTSEPSDWSSNWMNYYKLDTTTGQFIQNESETYVGGITYYQKHYSHF